MSQEQKALVIAVAEQKVVHFMEDELIAVRAANDEVYVSIGHLADALSMDRQGQTQRIERSPVLLSGYCRGEINTAGGPQQAYLLRVDLVPFWLAGINTNRIKDEARQSRIIQYQQNVAKVLWEAFQEGRLTAEPDFEDLIAADSPAAHAYKMARATMHLARQQLLLESRVAAKFADYDQRLETIESQLGDPRRQITPAQAMQISQAVKGIAMALSKQTGRNEYGGVYGELYRRFEINSYKLLPAARFEEAMRFLNDWYQDLVGAGPF